jgi:hypothetical protein
MTTKSLLSKLRLPAIKDRDEATGIAAGTAGLILARDKAALIRRGSCGFAVKAANAQAAGAKAVVIYNNSAGRFSGTVAGSGVTIPTVTAVTTVNGLAVYAVKDMFDTDSGTTYASAVAGSVVKEIADNAGGASMTLADIADAVWDEVLGVRGAGSAGEALAAAGTAAAVVLTSLSL